MAPIKVGEYIFRRLKQLGVNTCWGVPGDYELALLDLIEDGGIKFSGNPNELVAAYAADGYGRLNGVGAWVDTFGPGELSSYCGHAGAYAEYVPVAHIVGYPGRDAMKAGTLMHHSLGTGKFDMYEKMVKHISVDTAVLLDPEKAPEEIDRCLQTMLDESRPCYIGVPVDMSHKMCEGSALAMPLRTELARNDAQAEKEMVVQLRGLLEKAQHPIIISDGFVTRAGCIEEAQKLSALTGLPTFSTSMGKGNVDESKKTFGGIYNGGGTHEAVKKSVETSDCVFWLGNVPTDFNTGEFTTNVAENVTVDFQRLSIKVGSKKHDLKMKYVLQALNKSIEGSPLQSINSTQVNWDPYPLANTVAKGTELTQDYLWGASDPSVPFALGRFLKPGDFVIGETGTSAFGLGDSRLPEGASMYNQTIFGSIGYATGAAVGAFKSIVETGKYKRCILVTGEGSLHLTIQAFMDMLKLELKPIVIVLNNDGYTVERLIHGPEASYNKLPHLDYSLLARAFGPEHKSKYWGPAGTADELEAVFADAEFADGEYFRLLEVKLGYLDAPTSVKMAGAAVEAFNRRQGTSVGA